MDNRALYPNWFDVLDVERPYRVLYVDENASGEKIKRVARFENETEARLFYQECEGFRMLSFRNIRNHTTRYLAYDYGK